MPNNQTYPNPGVRKSEGVSLSAIFRPGSPPLPDGSMQVSGLAVDGETITVTANGYSGFTFGTGPSRRIYMGFGVGPLYDLQLGSPVGSHTDPISGNNWSFERARTLAETAGIRVLSHGPSGASINFDYGMDVPENTPVMLSSIVRAYADQTNWASTAWHQVQSVNDAGQLTLTAPWSGATTPSYRPGGDGAIVSSDKMNTKDPLNKKLRINMHFVKGSAVVTAGAGADFTQSVAIGDYVANDGNTQWKTYRARGQKNLDKNLDGTDATYSGWYHKTFAGDDTTPNKGEFNRYVGGYSSVKHGGPHPAVDNKWTRHSVFANPGVTDTESGTFIGQDIKPADGDGIREGAYGSGVTRTGYMLYKSTDRNRWRWFLAQDFLQYCLNAVIERTDFAWQFGSLARFELANGPTPATTTEAYILPVKVWGDEACALHAWKSFFPSYAGLYIHFYNDLGIFTAAVALPNAG